MQPYVICDSDHLLQVAHKFGFDPDEVWNDPSNADLRKLRPDFNVLLAGDVLYIPDQVDKPVTFHNLAVGSTNSFVAPNPPKVSVSVRFIDANGSTHTSKSFTIEELPELQGLKTTDEGVATFSVPVNLGRATLVFDETGEARSLWIASMDPIDTLSGIFKRLQNLGFIGQNEVFDDKNLDILRGGLCALRLSAKSGGDLDGCLEHSLDGESFGLEYAGLSDDGVLASEVQKLLVEEHGC
jgi:N-acetylmuramoyl-L-alanine amidase